MKIYGVFDPDRTRDELTSIIDRMSRAVDPKSGHQLDHFAMNEVAVGRSFSPLTARDLQPVWNEERTQFIVMAGKVFGYEEKKSGFDQKRTRFPVREKRR